MKKLAKPERTPLKCQDCGKRHQHERKFEEDPPFDADHMRKIGANCYLCGGQLVVDYGRRE